MGKMAEQIPVCCVGCKYSSQVENDYPCNFCIGVKRGGYSQFESMEKPVEDTPQLPGLIRCDTCQWVGSGSEKCEICSNKYPQDENLDLYWEANKSGLKISCDNCKHARRIVDGPPSPCLICRRSIPSSPLEILNWEPIEDLPQKPEQRCETCEYDSKAYDDVPCDTCEEECNWVDKTVTTTSSPEAYATSDFFCMDCKHEDRQYGPAPCTACSDAVEYRKRAVTTETEPPPSDPVSHPSHYTSHPSGVEAIQITECFNFNRGNAIKYIWRSEHKGKEIEDLKKAVFYLEREIARITKGDK